MAQAVPAYAKPQTRSALRRYPVALALVVGLILSLIAFVFIRNRQARLVQLEFQQQAGDYAIAVRRNMDDHLGVLESIGRFYSASQSVERNEFQAFVQAALGRQPDIQALYWVPRVPLAQRSVYESVAAQDGLTDFAIVEWNEQGERVRVPPRNEYYPLFYIEPLVGNTRHLGQDLASNPDLRLAMVEARDGGHPAAARLKTAPDGSAGGHNILVLMPVYLDASLATGPEAGTRPNPGSGPPPPPDPALVAERRRSLTGFAAVALQVDTIALAALRAQNGPPMRATLLSLPPRPPGGIPDTAGDPLAILPPPQPARAYTPLTRAARPPDAATASAGARSDIQFSAQAAPPTPSDFNWEVVLDVAGLQWSLRFDAPPGYLSAFQVWAPWGVLAVSMWITALVASYLRILFDRTTQVEREVEARTVELSLANTELQEREAQSRSFTEYLSALQETTLGLVTHLELTDLLQTIVSRAADLLGTAHGYVYLVEPGGKVMTMKVGIGIHSPFVGSQLKPGEGLGGQVWRTGQPMTVTDYRTWPGRLTDARSEQIQVMVAEPLKSGAEVVGVIAVSYAEEGRTVSAGEVSILHRFAQLASVALDNARLYTTLQQELAERTQAQAALEQAKEAAVAANRAKSTFLANMSHELRTPLNAIIGYSEMLLEEVADSGRDDLTADLEKIGAAGRHLLSLISDILDLSKIEAGKVELHLERIDVAHLVQEVTTTVQPLMQKNANTFQVVAGDGTGEAGAEWGVLYADLVKVRQVLLNLLSNAAKFTERGAVTLTVSRTRAATTQPGGATDGASLGAEVNPPPEWLIFSVRDTGIGISPEHMDRLFHAFTQADASTTRKYGGTGLGLAISYHFCQLMGGSIDVESAPGRGSIFTVYLPAQVTLLKPSPGKVRVDGLNTDGTSDF